MGYIRSELELLNDEYCHKTFGFQACCKRRIKEPQLSRQKIGQNILISLVFQMNTGVVALN